MRIAKVSTRTMLAAILLVALGLRLINLGGRTLWYDEAFAVLFSEQGFAAMLDGTVSEVDGAAADVHPLLYYTLLDYWMALFGQGVATVRLLSVLLGVVTVGVVYLLARDWFEDDRTALVAALITGVAPFHVQYSQEARMYALMALVLLLATWAFWRAMYRGGRLNWLMFGILAGISMYTQQLAAFYLVALALLPVLLRDWKRLLPMAGAVGIALAVYLPWLRFLMGQMSKLNQYWVQKPNVLHLWLTLRSFISVNLDFSTGWWLPTFLLAAILVVFMFLRAWAVWSDPERKDREGIVWAVWLAIAPMTLMWVVSTILQPVFLPRALLPSALIFYVAMAWLFTRGGMPILITGVLLGAWGVVGVFGLVTLYSWATFPNAPFDDATDYIATQIEAGDVIVHGNKITALPSLFYARDLPQRYVRDIPGSGSDTLAVPTQDALQWRAVECPPEAVDDASRVWYVAFDKFEDEMTALVENSAANARYDTLSWLRRHYSEEGFRQFNDLDLYLFVKCDAGEISSSCGE